MISGRKGVFLKVLGPVSLCDEDGLVVSGVLAQPKRLALLAYLASAPAGAQLQRDTIVGLLWSEMREERARAALSKALHFLRHHLGDSSIVTHGEGAISVDPDAVRCDAREFDEACENDAPERAIALYGGPFLDGFFVSDASEFQFWLDRERDRRLRSFRRMLEDLANRMEAEGSIARAVELRQQLVDLDPYDGRSIRLLMESFVRNGNSAGALRAAAAHEASLRRELGVDPDVAITELVSQLRRPRPKPSPQLEPEITRPTPAANGADASVSDATAVKASAGVSPTTAPAPSTPRPTGARRIPSIAAVVLIVLAVATTPLWRGKVSSFLSTAADTARYAVIPFAVSPGIESSLDPATLLHDSLLTWTGISVVGPDVIGDELRRAGRRPATVRDAAAMARGVGAGRFLWGDVSAIGDSLRILARIGDTESQTPIADRAIVVPRTRAGISALAALLPELLVHSVPSLAATELAGSRDLPALRAYVAGRRHMESWSLTDASRAFEDAIARDARFASAHLWLALARNWNGAEPTRFRLPAEQAQRFIHDLPPREQQMTRAVLAEARGELGTACIEWRGRTNADSLDFVAWYGEGHCEREDDVVVPDVRSPSGWRYRSSLAHALYDYQRAFRLQPLILFAFRESSFRPLRTLFFAGETYYRSGRTEGEHPRVFTARIAIAGDSLVTVPFPGPFARYPSERGLDAFAEAVRRQRLLVRDVASSWVSAFPDHPDARYALALSLAALGDPQASDTLAAARRNARSPEQALLLALADVWMSVGLGVSRRQGEFLSRARSLADSLLAATSPARTTQPLPMAAVAALTGRATLAAQYARRPEVARAYRAEAPLAGIAVPLLIYALFAAPADSLAAFEQRVSMEIASHPGADPRNARLQWLARAATLCYPLCRMRSRDSLLRAGDELLDAQADRDAERFDAVRAFFARTAAARAHRLVELVSLDALAPEAELLASLGDDREAARWIEPTLLHASEIPPELLGFPERTVALVRGMSLLAGIAERAGNDGDAKRWREMVNILWSNADSGVWPDAVLARGPRPAAR